VGLAEGGITEPPSHRCFAGIEPIIQCAITVPLLYSSTWLFTIEYVWKQCL